VVTGLGMRIDAANTLPGSQEPDRPGSTFVSKPREAGQTVLGSDTASLSSAGQRVESLKAELQNTPEVRRDRVQALQKAVQQGSYQVTNQQIANAILSDPLGLSPSTG
jgi:negative regulator of flagellin synthesis FlgM